jgi:hypothetical protein
MALVELKPYAGKLHFYLHYNKINIDFSVNLLAQAKNITRDKSRPLDILEGYLIEYRRQEQYALAVNQAYNTIYGLANRNEIKAAIENIINVFDYDTISAYIEKQKYLAPSSIQQDFNTEKGQNGIISQDRTYVWSEYFELIKIAIVIKAIAPIIALTVTINSSLYIKDQELLLCLNYIKDSWLFETNGMERLQRYIRGHIEAYAGADLPKIAARRGITIDDIPDYIFANALFKKLFITQIDKVPGAKTIINEIYSTITSTMANNVGVKNNITYKKPGGGLDDENAEGQIEAVRQSSNVPIGNEVQYNTFTECPFRLLEWMGLDTPENRKEVERLIEASKILVDNPNGEVLKLSNVSLQLMNIVTEHIIPYNWKQLINRQGIVNLMIVTTIYIRSLGFNNLANIVLSYVPDYNEMHIEGNTSHISKELVERLYRLYPIEEEVVKKGVTSYLPYVTRLINKLDKDLRVEPVVTIVPDDYLSTTKRIVTSYITFKDEVALTILNIKGSI